MYKLLVYTNDYMNKVAYSKLIDKLPNYAENITGNKAGVIYNDNGAKIMVYSSQSGYTWQTW